MRKPTRTISDDEARAFHDAVHAKAFPQIVQAERSADPQNAPERAGGQAEGQERGEYVRVRKAELEALWTVASNSLDVVNPSSALKSANRRLSREQAISDREEAGR